MSRQRSPRVLWAGVVVKLDDGRTVAVEFDGAANFITADIHTLKPWDQRSRNKTQDEVSITVQGNGRVWTEGEHLARERGRVVNELGAAPAALEARREGN